MSLQKVSWAVRNSSLWCCSWDSGKKMKGHWHHWDQKRFGFCLLLAGPQFDGKFYSLKLTSCGASPLFRLEIWRKNIVLTSLVSFSLYLSIFWWHFSILSARSSQHFMTCSLRTSSAQWPLATSASQGMEKSTDLPPRELWQWMRTSIQVDSFCCHTVT